MLTHGYAVIDGAYGQAVATQIHASIATLHAQRRLRAGRLQHGAKQTSDTSVRSDKITFITPAMGKAQGVSPTLGAYMQQADELRARLGTARMRSLVRGPLEGCTFMCAVYPGAGARYVKHRDALPYSAGRKLTIIYYVNQEWRPEHGGCLRIWPTAERPPLDVAPRSDRLVIFVSSLEHEVMPAWQPRYALTTWLYNKRDTALESFAEELRQRKAKGQFNTKALLQALDNDSEDDDGEGHSATQETLSADRGGDEEEGMVDSQTAQKVLFQLLRRSAAARAKMGKGV